jgi:hypothetical protein
MLVHHLLVPALSRRTDRYLTEVSRQIFTWFDTCQNPPMEPPIAIICRWRPFNLRASGELAVFAAAASGSKTVPSAPTLPFGAIVMAKFGSLLKLSITLRPSPS